MSALPADRPSHRFFTHDVENAPPPLAPYDAWATDLPLREAMAREGAGWASSELAPWGAVAGGEAQELARLANDHPPRLKSFDAFGRRLDEVEFHPAYHRLMELGVTSGVTSMPWLRPHQHGAHVARMGLSYLLGQADQGTGCPLTMTYACVPALRAEPKLAAEWLPKILSPRYDGRCAPPGEKPGLTVGMCMTEKQGGSDVRANTTRAHPLGAGAFELVGHKWFVSGVMSDAFLALAQDEAGLSCFLLPRWTPEGRRNALRLLRLKDKLGDKSNATAEVELQGALAFRVGEPGRGVATILQMVALTRQDCAIGSAALMRQALVQALHHARHRRAFGKRLAEQPLMQNVLADLALESEAHLALAARIARAIDGGARDEREAAFARIVTAIGKYWTCKRGPAFVAEAMECLGGAGYVEETSLPRLYRQAPVNSIWEGSGNIQCLDVLRALAKEPAALDALVHELSLAKGGHPALDRELARLPGELTGASGLEPRARRVVERLAVALQSALLVRAGNAAVADTWCASRLGGEHGQAFGTLEAGAPLSALLERALPT
ncbi:MAG: isovaleryl-CoA dehydrogenase [Archangiaceae bacterium]|nr:isovaleryl-CoA dehydrogenase [Archangiaceae bacterium]